MEKTGGNSIARRPRAELKTVKCARNVRNGSGGWIRTNDLRVMSLTASLVTYPLHILTDCSIITILILTIDKSSVMKYTHVPTCERHLKRHSQ